MQVIRAGSSLGVKWSSTPHSTGMCRGVGLTCITSHTYPTCKASSPEETELPSTKCQTLVVRRAAYTRLSRVVLLVLPIQDTHKLPMAGESPSTGTSASFQSAPSSIPAYPQCSQPAALALVLPAPGFWSPGTAHQLFHKLSSSIFISGLPDTKGKFPFPGTEDANLPPRHSMSSEAVGPQTGQMPRAS